MVFAIWGQCTICGEYGNLVVHSLFQPPSGEPSHASEPKKLKTTRHPSNWGCNLVSTNQMHSTPSRHESKQSNLEREVAWVWGLRFPAGSLADDVVALEPKIPSVGTPWLPRLSDKGRSSSWCPILGCGGKSRAYFSIPLNDSISIYLTAFSLYCFG